MDRPESTYTDTVAFYEWLKGQVPEGWYTLYNHASELQKHCACARLVDSWGVSTMFHFKLRKVYVCRFAQLDIERDDDPRLFDTPQEAIAYWMLTKNPS